MDNQAPEQNNPTPAPSAPQTPASNDGGGYKKGGMGKWILIYLVIAVVVYGLIYLWYKHNHPSTSTSGTTSGSLY